VQEAPVVNTLLVNTALAGTQFAVPRLVLPLKNCTFPVGPRLELLLEEINAVKVAELAAPDAVTPVVVCACVIVTLSVLLAGLFW
jgi:hypothetical protein